VTIEILASFLERPIQQRLRPLQFALVLEQTDVAARVAGRRIDRLERVRAQRDVRATRPLTLLGDDMAQQCVEGAAGPDLGQRRTDAGAIEFPLQRPLADLFGVGHVGALLPRLFPPAPAPARRPPYPSL